MFSCAQWNFSPVAKVKYKCTYRIKGQSVQTNNSPHFVVDEAAFKSSVFPQTIMRQQDLYTYAIGFIANPRVRVLIMQGNTSDSVSIMHIAYTLRPIVKYFCAQNQVVLLMRVFFKELYNTDIFRRGHTYSV